MGPDASQLPGRLGAITIVLIVVLTFCGSRYPAKAAPPDTEARYVVVRYASAATDEALSSGRPLNVGQEGFRRLKVPDETSLDEYLAVLRADPLVISADADVRVQATVTPNDPYFQANQASYLGAIGAPAAWDLETGSSSVVVAVLDSGTDTTHPDLAGRLWRNTAPTAADGCADGLYGCRFVNLTPERRRICGYTTDGPSGDIQDDNGIPGTSEHSHGTIVAGVIGAGGNNNTGVTGVAWNVRIMSVKVLDCGTGLDGLASGDLSNVAEGIDYATRMGANIICLSLQGTDDLPVLRAAIAVAQRQGVIIVAAAGNHLPGGPTTPGYPAAYTQYPNVVGVGAADNENGMAWAPFSNWGPGVDFAAPGVHIASTTRVSFGSYGVLSGTSLAAPIVAGMFALMESRNSKLSADELLRIARDAATPASPATHGGNWAGAGIVNLGAAVARVPMQLQGTPLHDWKDVPVGTEIIATIDGNLCGSTHSSAFGAVAIFKLNVDSAASTAGCGSPGKSVKLSIAGLDAGEVTWGSPGEDLGLSNRQVVAVSPPPGPIVIQSLNAGWSNVAHLDAPGRLPQALSYLPSGWGEAFRWDRSSSDAGKFVHEARDAPAFVSDWPDIATYDAYWVNAPAKNFATLNPNPAAGRLVSFKTGWNNFVYTGESRQVWDALGSIAGAYTQVLSYDNANQAWLFYTPGQPRYANDFGGLLKLRVYWIYVTAPVVVAFD